MKISAFNKNLLPYGFMVCALMGWGFIYYQKLQLLCAFDESLQIQQNLQKLMIQATDTIQKTQHEIQMHTKAIEEGFFKKLRPRELKKIIDTLALQCHINQVYTKFSPLRYDIKSVCMRSIKLTFQAKLDEDVFHLIDALKRQSIGLINVRELNIFREYHDLSRHNLLNVEIHIEILNIYE